MNKMQLDDFLIPSARDFEPVWALAALLGDPVGFKARLAELAEKSAQAQALMLLQNLRRIWKDDLHK
jgi:hypothetical protein